MGFRAALAALIAVLLLSVSCLASACETSCDLNALGTGCHHADATASAVESSAMHHCGMQAAKTSVQPSCGAIHANPCKHFLCEQALQAVTSDNEFIAAGNVTAQLAPVPSVSVFSMPVRQPYGPASKPPLSRAPLLVSLQTLLRV